MQYIIVNTSNQPHCFSLDGLNFYEMPANAFVKTLEKPKSQDEEIQILCNPPSAGIKKATPDDIRLIKRGAHKFWNPTTLGQIGLNSISGTIDPRGYASSGIIFE